MLTVGSGISIGPGIRLSTGTLTGSLLFTNSNITNYTQFLYTTANSGYSYVEPSLGTGAFTVELWINLSLNDLNRRLILAKYGSTSYEYYLDIFNGSIYWTQYTTSSGISNMVSATITNNQWHHLAIVSTGNPSGTTTMYIDGVNVSSTTNRSTPTNATGATFSIGQSLNMGDNAVRGYLSNIRIVKGVAVYTSNFTPSTHDLTDTQSANVNGSPSAAISSGQTLILMNTPDSNDYIKNTSSYYNNIVMRQYSYNTSNVAQSSNRPF